MLIKSAEDSKIGKNIVVKLYIPEQENLPQISSSVKRELAPPEFHKLKILKLSPQTNFFNARRSRAPISPKALYRSWRPL
jgi:hypothetical protein